MNRLPLITCRTLLVGCCIWPTAVSASGQQRDLPSETRAIFAAKCAGCHGADLAKPLGRFGYVLDLARVASNPEMVIPGSPDESELWELVQRDEMPPEDSPTGLLSSEQKEVIRVWIAAGAPVNSVPPAESNPAEAVTGRPSYSPHPREHLVRPTCIPFLWRFAQLFRDRAGGRPRGASRQFRQTRQLW